MGPQNPKASAARQGPARHGEALAPRKAALDMIGQVLDKGRMIDEAFQNACIHGRLDDPRDRGMVRMLATTLVRRLGQVDDAIGRYLDKPLPAKANRVRHVLRLGAVQILFTNTPAHAAVDTSVALIARDRHPGTRTFKGLVNAVLRRISENCDTILSGQDPVVLNLPHWLQNSWKECFGSEMMLQVGMASLAEAPLDLTLKPDLDPADWAEKLGAEILPTGSLQLAAGGQVESLPGFAEGAWWIQDMAASLPARLLGAKAGDRVLDLCAAPGGKTAQLAAMGCHVTAVDQSAERLERLRENLARLKLEAGIIVSDAVTFCKDRHANTPFPFILLDAPCTTTGTMRRHPDVMYHKSPADVGAMAKIQARLLKAAIDMLAPGGTLVYCVCSLQAEEGPEQIEALLASGAPVQRSPASKDELCGIEALYLPSGDVQTLPGLGGSMDGFYMARLTCNAAL